jgi:membrane-associated phospholipid phosphatase
LHVLAAALLISYVLPSGYESWRNLDSRVFFFLNGSLVDQGAWEWWWAWANTRYQDALVALFIGLCLVYPVSGFSREDLQKSLFLYVAMMLVLMVAKVAFSVVVDLFEWSGQSPTLVLSPAVRLSDLFPGMPIKDASTDSFPGDHAAVLWAWAGFVVLHSRSLRSCLIAGLPLLMILPRLVGGAHWTSDVVVGGLVIAIPTLAWTYYSPIVSRLADGLAWLGQPILRLLSTAPWFRQQDFFVYGPQRSSST